MRAGTLGLLMAIGLGMSVSAEAKPRDAVIAETQIAPGKDINEILEDNGWTVLALPSNMHLPGKLFKPGASSAEGTCIDATAVKGELPSIEAQGAKGFVVEAGGRKGPVSGSAGVQATSFQFKSITEVEQSVIEGFDMTLNEKCLQKLRDLQAKGTPIADWFVVQEVARARVKEMKCSSKEAAAEVRAMWIARGEVGAMSDCVESSEVTGVIAYKAKPVVDLMPKMELRVVDVPQVKAEVKLVEDKWASVMSEADALMYIRTAQAFQKAESLYEKACESGLAEACAELAVILWWGQYNDGANRPRASNLMRSSLPALEVGCKQGNMRACLHLGHAWSDGIGVEEHDARGVALFEQSCTGGDARGCLQLGFVTKDKSRAAELYEQSCTGGNVDGCFTLGLMYRKGEGVTKDKSRAAELYEQSCTGGYAEGCYNLGLMYRKGEGVTKDKSRAAELYEQSCTGGYAIGCAHLGSQYRYGIGVTKNQTTAKRYFAKACGMGEEEACRRLVEVAPFVTPAEDPWAGVMAEADGFMYGRGVPKDREMAEPLYEKACEFGLAEACAELAVILWWGQRNDGKNRPKASNLMRSSLPALEVGCKQGNMRACLGLGTALDDGIGAEENDARAAALYEQSCTGGNAEGCYNLGEMYRNGEGVTKDLSRAAELVEQSCTGGYAEGCFSLGNVTKDKSRAAAFYEQSCTGGSAEGCFSLGYLYQYSHGVTKDLSRAAELYEQSCTGGNANGCNNLGKLYRKGEGVTKNQTMAERYFAKACELRDPLACD
jgi:TPR repeat protein